MMMMMMMMKKRIGNRVYGWAENGETSQDYEEAASESSILQTRVGVRGFGNVEGWKSLVFLKGGGFLISVKTGNCAFPSNEVFLSVQRGYCKSRFETSLFACKERKMMWVIESLSLFTAWLLILESWQSPYIRIIPFMCDEFNFGPHTHEHAHEPFSDWYTVWRESTVSVRVMTVKKILIMQCPDLPTMNALFHHHFRVLSLSNFPIPHASHSTFSISVS